MARTWPLLLVAQNGVVTSVRDSHESTLQTLSCQSISISLAFSRLVRTGFPCSSPRREIQPVSSPCDHNMKVQRGSLNSTCIIPVGTEVQRDLLEFPVGLGVEDGHGTEVGIEVVVALLLEEKILEKA